MSSKNLTRLARQLSTLTGWSHQRAIQTLQAPGLQIPPANDPLATMQFLQALASKNNPKAALSKSALALDIHSDFAPITNPQQFSSTHPQDLTELDNLNLFKPTHQLLALTKLIVWDRGFEEWILYLKTGERINLPGSWSLRTLKEYARFKDVGLSIEIDARANLFNAIFTKNSGEFLGPNDTVSPEKLRSMILIHNRDLDLYFYIMYRQNQDPLLNIKLEDLATYIHDFHRPTAPRGLNDPDQLFKRPSDDSLKESLFQARIGLVAAFSPSLALEELDENPSSHLGIVFSDVSRDLDPPYTPHSGPLKRLVKELEDIVTREPSSEAGKMATTALVKIAHNQPYKH